jgi:hypothetical protein
LYTFFYLFLKESITRISINKKKLIVLFLALLCYFQKNGAVTPWKVGAGNDQPI